MHSFSRSALGLLLLLFALPVLAQSDACDHPNTSTLIGVVRNAHQRRPIADVIVTARSPSLQGELMVSTDAEGSYYLPQLPPGEYTLTFEKEGFEAYTRSAIQLPLNRIIGVDVELLAAAPEEPVRVRSSPPAVDVGASTVCVNVDQEFLKRIAVPFDPCDRTGASIPFEHSGPKCPEPHVSLNGSPSSILPSRPLGFSRPFPVPPPTL
ncbi:carboxypeptidase-like regulatory domain-containing protein [Myxococcus sp. Y35]|uniref:carboxypeptidase-like regulatory domain-containing protein n=1 Tax=Pseudomyxococcus flavus TaxID=3115648 RepID=UPI003CF75C03